MLVELHAASAGIVEYLVAVGDAVKSGDVVAKVVPAERAARPSKELSFPHVAAVEAAVERIANRVQEVQSRRRADGTPTVRDRALALADKNSLKEVGAGTGVVENGEFVPANYLLATCRVEGRAIVICGEDFSINGGTPNLPGLRKSIYTEKYAVQHGLPLVRLHEGAGANILTYGLSGAKSGGGQQSPEQRQKQKKEAAKSSLNQRRTGDPVYSEGRYVPFAKCLETVPVACVVVGSVAGLPAIRVAASHFCAMLKDACLLVAGPRIVEQARGLRPGSLTKADIGGAAVHYGTGLVDAVTETHEEACLQIGQFLSYLPSSVRTQAPKQDFQEPKQPEMLRSMVPGDTMRSFDMRAVIQQIVDVDTFFELKAGWAKSYIIGLARLGGETVGITANNNQEVGGASTAAACEKWQHLIKLCDQFRLPIIHFTDEPGFMVGEEHLGMLRAAHNAAMLGTKCVAPTATVLVRRLFGLGSLLHFGREAPLVIAWPTAKSGPMPAQAGIDVAFKNLTGAERAHMIAKAEEQQDITPLAESFGMHELIDPAETRPRLLDWLALLQPLHHNTSEARL